MKPKDLETRMRQFEYFHNMKVLPNTWIVLRFDGRSFHSLTENLEKPFDESFSSTMQATAYELMTDFGGTYCYTESDEISLLLPKTTTLFDREVEKLVSIGASKTTQLFHANSSDGLQDAHFDARICCFPTEEDVIDYFRWRQADASRCCLNGYAYWMLRQKKELSARKATSELSGKSTKFKHDLLMGMGVNFAELPEWQKNGTGFYWSTYMKKGLNPKTAEVRMTTRRTVKQIDDLPFGDKYTELLKYLLSSGTIPVIENFGGSNATS